MVTRRAAANASANEVSQEIARQLQEREREQQEEQQRIAPANWQMPAGGEVVSLGNGGPMLEEEPEEVQTPAERVLSMLSDVAEAGDARAYVKVNRLTPEGTMVWCKDYPAAQFEAGGYEMIRRQWGPGDYKVVLYGIVPGTKRFTIRTKADVTLAAPLIDDTPQAAQSPTSALEALVAQLAQGQQALMQLLADKPAPKDSMEEMTRMLGFAKMMREAFGPPPAAAGGGLKEIIEGVQSIMEVKDMISPPAAPETPMGMVNQMLPLIAQAMQQRGAQAPAPQSQAAQVPRLPNPAPAVSLPTIQPPQEGETVNPVAMLALRGHLATLVQMAKDNGPVEAGAELIYEHLPDDFITLLMQDNWFDLLKMVTSPDIDAQREWLTKARDAAMVLFQESPEGEETEGQVNAAPAP